MDSSSDNNNVCLSCLKQVDRSKRCGKCKTALYCSKECQAAHWSVHKNICEDSNGVNSFLNLHSKAKNHLEQGNYVKSEKLYSKLLERVRKPDPDQLMLDIMNDLAITYLYQSKVKEAESLFKECFDLKKLLLGESDPSTLSTMCNLGKIRKYNIK